VRFEVEGELPGPDACHCRMCRKHSGHVFASTDVEKSALTIEGEAQVRWYRSSDRARRGFCATCGSSLFWEFVGKDKIGIAMGAFETPTDTRLAIHIFVADKGDYYDIADDVPQHATYPGGPAGS
jgi:hypothetical protein